MMITIEKIQVFEYYNGSDDAYARSSKKKKNLITMDEFYIVRSLLSDLRLIRNGLAAQSYIDQVVQRLTENCDSSETIEYLKQLEVRGW